jgi:hypothetical protein
MTGWMVCIMCYITTPFWGILVRNYLNYDDGYSWSAWLADAPLAATAWALAITALNVIYFWATASFGIRFSNLTHRGILTSSGPKIGRCSR